MRFKMIFLIATLTFCLCGASLHGQAMEEIDSSPADAGDERLLFEEIPSVYSASKYEQKITEAPSSVSVITADEIRKYGYRSLAEILNSLKGFHTSYDRNYHYAGTRGFLRPGDYNTRFLLLIDGIRNNDNVYDAAVVGNDLPVDIDLIERIEVIRGPSSSLYGNSAFFGVINIITKRGRNYKGLEVSGEAGSFATYEKRLTYGNQFQNGFEFLVSGTAAHSEGDRSLYYEEFDSADTNGGIAENLDEEAYRSVFTRASYRDFTLEAGYNDRDKDVPTASFGTVFNDPRYNTRDVLEFVDLKYAHDYSMHSQVLARINYNRYYYDGNYPYDYAEEDDEEPYIVLNRDTAEGRWLGAELQGSRPLFGDDRVTLGGEYRHSLEQNQQNYDEEVYLNDERDLDNWGLFLQEELHLLDNLILNAGVRHDYSEHFGKTTNPRTALIFSPVADTTFKLLYGRAFRAPSAYELYYHDGEASQKAARDLDPETIETYELVWEQYLGDHLRATASAFYYDIEDLISMTTDPNDELLVFRNVKGAEGRGIDAEIEGNWPGSVQGRISYAYLLAESNATGVSLENAPKHLARLNVTVPVFRNNVFAGMENQYTSRVKTQSRQDVSDFVVTNLTLSIRDLVEGLEVSGSIYNILGEEYAYPGSGEHEQRAIEQDGRTWRLKVSYLF